MFVVEDEAHDEQVGRFDTLEDAVNALRRLSRTAWDAAPNRAPCTNWRNCGRRYELVEYDTRFGSWRELGRRPVLDVDAGGAVWADPSDAG